MNNLLNENILENSINVLEEVIDLEIKEFESFIKDINHKIYLHPSKFACLIIVLNGLIDKIHDYKSNINILKPQIKDDYKTKIEVLIVKIKAIIKTTNYFERQKEIKRYYNNIEDIELYFSKRYVLKISAKLKAHQIEYNFLKPLIDYIPLEEFTVNTELSKNEYNVLTEFINNNLKINIFEISSLIIIYYKFGDLHKLDGLLDFSFYKYQKASSNNKLNI